VESCCAVPHGCPCGFYNDPQKNCQCSPLEIKRYRAKISGPLLDRIDLHIEVPSLKYQELVAKEETEPSAEIRKRVNLARERQKERFKNTPKIHSNGMMTTRQIRKFCQINQESQFLLKEAMEKLRLSARAYDRILKVSRTIADLEESEQIKAEHIAEAIQYRTLDRKYLS
jgi:magnesium chelatase family protein